MPRREENTTQTSKQGEVKWWIPAIIGILLLMIPGGLYVAPIFFLMAIVARRKNKPKESPETPPLPLINITPNPHS
jgi:flagellar basal body-associated protein FliL